MWVEINGMTLGGMAALNLNEQGFLQVTNLELNAEFSSIKIHFDNLVGGGNLGEVINQILSIQNLTMASHHG